MICCRNTDPGSLLAQVLKQTFFFSQVVSVTSHVQELITNVKDGRFKTEKVSEDICSDHISLNR